MDAVGVFVDLAKLAEDKPKPEPEKPELDPGEQAALAYGSMRKGLVIAALAAHTPLRALATLGTVKWRGPAFRGASHVRDIIDLEKQQSFTDKLKLDDQHSFLGLFNLKSNPARQNATVSEMESLANMQPIVDSFIDKYDLANKGVTMDFRYSPLHGIRGARYDTLTKVVTMPRLSKELMLHELGHAADYASMSKVRGVIENVVPGVLLSGLIPASYLVGDEIKKALPGSVTEDVVDFTQRHGPALAMLAMSAKVLYPEGKASWLAIKHIHDVEGMAAAKDAAKKLLPMFGAYAIATLPIVAGLSVAKKYFYETHRKLKKEASVRDFVSAATAPIRDLAGALTDVGVQMWHGLAQLTHSVDPIHALFVSGETIARSPQFRFGAISAGVPAALGAYAAYAHPGGKLMRDKIFALKEKQARAGKLSPRELQKLRDEREYDDWREKNPKEWAAGVGLAAGITGGIMAKMFHDVGQVI